MSIIKVEDIAFVRFRAPDLARMAGFLEDFGLTVAAQDENHLFARAAGPAPFVHVTERGEPGFAGLAFSTSPADLETLARAEGVAVEPLDAPGGGQVVSLTDPDGRLVQIVAGQAPAEKLAAPSAADWNRVDRHDRLRQARDVAKGAAHVQRLGHCVLNVGNFRAAERWYKERFGFITSDEIAVSPEFSLGAFLRCDRGAEPTDHHTLFLAQTPRGVGFNHAAFEVIDFDDLMVGHERLKQAGHSAEWGVGRHILGSQIFDYWRDPWGHALEHWTDGDLFTAEDGSRVVGLPQLLGVHWGPAAPPTMG